MSKLAHQRLIVIVGPTAVGKTNVAVKLAQILHTEIISADSRQLYKELTIGTAKPTKEELNAVPHHFVDWISIEQSYDAGQYAREALDLMTKLFNKHDHQIMCGGSGMYIKAVLEGFDEMPEVPSALRSEIIAEYAEKGLSWLQEQISISDPDYFQDVDQKNPQRLMRALELIRASGKPASTFRKNIKQKLPFEVVKIGLELDRAQLYDRINHRVEQMMEAGLMEEVKQLYPKKEINALQTVGYQELFGYLDGEYDINEAVRLLKRNTRRYAKRQLTWFKKDAEVTWFHPQQFDEILNFINGK